MAPFSPLTPSSPPVDFLLFKLCLTRKLQSTHIWFPFVPHIIFLSDGTGLDSMQLEQRSASDGQQAKSSLPSFFFVNKGLLGHSQAHSLTYYLWLFPTTAATLSSYARDHMAHKPKAFTTEPFAE